MLSTILAFAVPDLAAGFAVFWHMLAAGTPNWWTVDSETLVRAAQIVWIDLVLSGDNAVVIALACRGLPPRLQRTGIILGALTAVAMRIVFTMGVQTFLTLPWLKIIGGLILLWIAFKLVRDKNGHTEVGEATSLWSAIRIIAIADIVMSLDNVLAIAAAAHGDWRLIIFGLVVSIPLVMLGASVFTSLLERFPILVWLGAALLGWVAGELIASDAPAAPTVAAIASAIGASTGTVIMLAAALGAVLVLATAAIAGQQDERTPAKS